MVLDALLCALSVEEQQIIILHAVHGMKNREIADILDLPLNTVLSKYHRAIKKMRKRMEGERV
jgi:RNA polymerase sigma-70 factor (ECF subfamily)